MLTPETCKTGCMPTRKALDTTPPAKTVSPAGTAAAKTAKTTMSNAVAGAPTLVTPPPSTPQHRLVASADEFGRNSESVTPFTASSHRSAQSPGQEPGSARYIERLWHSARRAVQLEAAVRTPRSASASGWASPSSMADFLASFGIGNDTGNKYSKEEQCPSADELADKLQALLDENTNETRAEHVTSNLELSNSAQFNLSVTENENDALESLNSVDPSLGGVRSATLSADTAESLATRVVQASDTIMKQSDNPLLQRTVAKHIIQTVSTRDHSTWVLRDVSRGPSGWTFNYICKASLQHWTRQNAKNQTKAVIGDCTLREPDPVLMSRPAFDCRGSATIAFNRNNRCINVKYDHTLLHKTVEELSKAYPPPVRVFGPGYERQQQQKLQAKEQKKKLEQKTPREPNGESKEKRRKKKRAAPVDGDVGADGERPKKRHKKKKEVTEDTAMDTPGRSVMPSDYPGALPTNEQAGSSGPKHGSDAPAQQAPAPVPASGALLFNVSPEEAARRLAIARKLLSDHGVNPDSLSVDQMNIFSNQAPALQQDSVQMLAKYGAERLQIIHPSNKDKASTDCSTGQVQQATQRGPTTSKELAPNVSTSNSGRKSKPTPKAINGDQPTAYASDATPSKPKRKLGKSRLACLSCKNRRVKCPKEQPSCSECQSEAQTCEYPPQKPRSRKSEVVITTDADKEEEDHDEGEEEVEGGADNNAEYFGNDGRHHQGDLSHAAAPPADGLPYNQMPVADMLTPSMSRPQGHDQQGYFDTGANLDTAQSPYPALPDPLNTSSGNVMASTAAASPEQGRRSLEKSAGGSSRRGLPQGSSGNVTANSTSSWMAAHNSTAGTNNNTTPPGHAQQAMRGQHQARPSNMSTKSPQLRENSTQPAQNSTDTSHSLQSPQMVAAMQSEARRSPLQAQQQQQRVASQQDQRSQTRTPNSDTLRRPCSPPAHKHSIQQAPPPQNNDLVASSAYNNYGRYVGNNAAAADASQRIAYEPYSQQQRTTAAPTSTPYPAFGMDRDGATTMSMAAATTMASTYNNQASTGGQWSGSGRSSHHDDRTSGFGGSGSYGPSAADSATLSNFDMRGNAQKRGSSGYTTQTQPGHQQQADSQGSWNYFGGSENNYGPNGPSWV